MHAAIVSIVFLYFGLLLYFPNVAWGLAENVQVFNLYNRGTGVFPVSIMSVFLYLIFLLTTFVCKGERNVLRAFNLRIFFWSFNALFLVFIIWGVIIGVPVKETISGRGLINVFNMYLMIAILLKTISTKDTLKKLSHLIIFCALTRGIWGLVRWAFLGGDPANVYANVQLIAVRLTFFDINDSLISTIAVFLSAWFLLHRGSGLTTWQKIMYWAMIIVGLPIIVLSYRRTAWAGMLLSCTWFVWRQNLRRKILIGILSGLMVLLVLPGVIKERFANGMLYDITLKDGEIQIQKGRFAELNAAWSYIARSPLTGVMPWGGIGPNKAHDFVHSGFLHLWLKGGVFALIFFCLINIGFVLFIRKLKKAVPLKERGMAEAAFAGFLFLIPTLFAGTPFIEFRTSLLLGVCFVLPYTVYGLHNARKINYSRATFLVTGNALNMKRQM